MFNWDINFFFRSFLLFSNETLIVYYTTTTNYDNLHTLQWPAIKPSHLEDARTMPSPIRSHNLMEWGHKRDLRSFSPSNWRVWIFLFLFLDLIFFLEIFVNLRLLLYESQDYSESHTTTQRFHIKSQNFNFKSFTTINFYSVMNINSKYYNHIIWK